MAATQQQALPLITGFGHTKDGRTLYTVTSRSRPGAFHLVTTESGRHSCDCEAGKFGKHCAHVEAVKAKIKAKKPVTAVTTEYREPSFRDSAPLFRDNEPFSIFARERFERKGA